MKVTVDITDRQSFIDLNRALCCVIRRSIRKTLEMEETAFNCEVSVLITDDTEIQNLNKIYRGIDKPTDVLSFPLDTEPINGGYKAPVMLGDIVISAERAVFQANEYQHSLNRELAFLTVHAALHLLGYDHETSLKQKTAMFRRQEDILQALGYQRV